MSEKASSLEPTWDEVSLESRQTLVGLVKSRADKEGLTGKALASQIGVSQAWLTSFYHDLTKDVPGMRPSETATRAIALALGGDLLQYTPWSESNTLAHEYERGMALLWTARRALLNHLSYAEHARPRVVSVLSQLSQDVEQVSSTHPIGKQFLENGRSLGLEEMAASCSPILRHLVFAELLFMKIDAPFETGYQSKLKLKMLERIGQELKIPRVSITRVLKDFKNAIEKKNELPPVAGALTRVYFPFNDLNSVLVGHDPSGWFGFQFISGSWLVCGLRNAERSEHEPTGAVKDLGWKNKRKAAVTAATLGSAVSLLGPVVGLMVAHSVREKNAEASKLKLLGASDSMSADRMETAQSIADAAIAFGPEWTEFEILKIRAFYYSIEFDDKVKSSDLEMLGLPEEQVALQNLTLVRNALGVILQSLEEKGISKETKMYKELSKLIRQTEELQLESIRNGRLEA